MRTIVICAKDVAEQEQISKDVCRFYETVGVTVKTQCCADWPALAGVIKEERPETLVLAQDGVEGIDTLTGLTSLPMKVLWFSDLDFGVQSYRLGVGYFGKKPVTYEKLAVALSQWNDNRRLKVQDIITNEIIVNIA